MKVEAAVFMADHLPANAQLAGEKRHGTGLCVSLQKYYLLYGLTPGNLINSVGKGEIKKADGSDEV